MGTRIRNNRLRGEKWHECALCGMEYPVSWLWQRRGQLVCREHCADQDLLKEAEPIIGDDTQKAVIPE